LSGTGILLPISSVSSRSSKTTESSFFFLPKPHSMSTKRTVASKSEWAELENSPAPGKGGAVDLPFDLSLGMAEIRKQSTEMGNVFDMLQTPQIFTEPASQIRGGRNYFQSICYAVCAQQVADSAAKTMYSNLEKICENNIAPDIVLRLVGFVDASDNDLGSQKGVVKACKNFETTRSNMKTSKAKLVAIVGVSANWMEIEKELTAIPMNEETLRSALTKVTGVGKWTVDMLMLFKFRLPDVW